MEDILTANVDRTNPVTFLHKSTINPTKERVVKKMKVSFLRAHSVDIVHFGSVEK